MSLSLGLHPTFQPGQHNDRWTVTYLRALLCEKPMALSIADGRKMMQAADEHGVVLAVNHHLPGAATHRAIQRMVSSGGIGAPLGMRIGHAVMIPERLRGWRLTDPAGGGVILDITVHDVSAAQAILGTTATEASAIAVRQGAWASAGGGPPDAVMATLRFRDVPVQLYDAFTVAHFRSSLEVIGTEGCRLSAFQVGVRVSRSVQLGLPA